WLLEEFPSGYTAGELKDSKGQTVPGSNRVTTYSTTSHIVFASRKRFLQGWIAGEVLLPLVDVDVQLANGTESRVRGFADLTVGAGLQWAPKKIGSGVFVNRAMIDVGVPTGKYSASRPVNLGNHFVVVDPYYAFTYERKKVELSARLHYLWNSTNNDPFIGFGIKDMQSGQAFHFNYATSYELFKNVRLGFNGYWLQQITDHEINGVAIPNSKERTVGLGPGIQLGGQGIWFRVNSYIETDVRNRPSGIKVTFRVSKALPSEQSQP
ncbi:MAG TPA: transporter, partial [Chthoniobacterales bacterium]|nr:transporter [Chthoniobacterales bacterium]